MGVPVSSTRRLTGMEFSAVDVWFSEFLRRCASSQTSRSQPSGYLLMRPTCVRRHSYEQMSTLNMLVLTKMSMFFSTILRSCTGEGWLEERAHTVNKGGTTNKGGARNKRQTRNARFATELRGSAGSERASDPPVKR